MENKMQEFYNEEFGKIRIIEKDGVPWFVGKDLAGILGYANSYKAIKDHVDNDDLTNRYPIVDTLGREQKATIINESGFYSLILSSKLPTAKAFKRWVTSEVLPSIRKHGVYITDEVLQKILQNRAYGDWLLNELQNERVKSTVMKEYIGELEPKARYYDLILQCKNAVPISIIAKDYGVSAIALNRFLNILKVQYKLRDTWLLYQEHAGNGYTKSITYLVKENKALVHTYWTQKGRLFIYELLKEICILPVCERSGADVTA